MPEKDFSPVDSVLLIDGDNDPHLPPDFPITDRTLVRVFLRPGAKMPRGLERRFAALPFCISVLSPKGGSNAADFVMSLHAGMLHATLPMHLPFTLVTNDKSLSVMAQELQRVGRQATLWTSHPENRGVRRKAAETPAPARRRNPRAQISRPKSPTVATAVRTLSDIAAAYAARLSKIKDPPSRVKTLINDIANRAAISGHRPEEVLEELKRAHGLSVDAGGRVRYPSRAA